MIVSGADLVLTDYDCVTNIGKRATTPGTVLYCSPSYLQQRDAMPSDDLYALAASFFQVLFSKEPFQYGGIKAKERGLNWEGVKREEYPLLAGFMDRATNPDPTKRLVNVVAALATLSPPTDVESPRKNPRPKRPTTVRANRYHSRESNRTLKERRGKKTKCSGSNHCFNPIPGHGGAIARHAGWILNSPRGLTSNQSGALAVSLYHGAIP